MKFAREALPFQAVLDRLVVEPAPVILRLWPALGLALIASLEALSATVRLDVVVTDHGRIAADAAHTPPFWPR